MPVQQRDVLLREAKAQVGPLHHKSGLGCLTRPCTEVDDPHARHCHIQILEEQFRHEVVEGGLQGVIPVLGAGVLVLRVP